jgi:hypothetical protein
MIDGISKAAGRLIDIASGEIPQADRQRMRAQADIITRTNAITLHVAVMNEVIGKLIRVLYEVDGDSLPSNYDRLTGRIRVSLPWADTGWAQWRLLRKWEAELLRKVLKKRIRKGEPLPFDFSKDSLRWYLRLDVYPTLPDALAWLVDYPISPIEWRQVIEWQDRQRQRRKDEKGKRPS